MSTLGDMKARIADEIFRDDLATAIAREIASAIQFYQSKRFYFQESYSFTFNTSAGQAFYGIATNANLSNLISIDFVNVTQNGSITELQYAQPSVLDRNTYPPSSGVPYYYTYYASALRLYPIPLSALPVRVAGLIPVAAPQTDAEIGNPWMNDAEELIRSRAKRNIYLHSLGDLNMAQVMKSAEDEALQSLQQETSSRTQIDSFLPSEAW